MSRRKPIRYFMLLMFFIFRCPFFRCLSALYVNIFHFYIIARRSQDTDAALRLIGVIRLLNDQIALIRKMKGIRTVLSSCRNGAPPECQCIRIKQAQIFSHSENRPQRRSDPLRSDTRRRTDSLPKHLSTALPDFPHGSVYPLLFYISHVCC